LLNVKNKITILLADKISLSGIDFLPENSYTLIEKYGITNSDILKHFKSVDVLAIRSTRKIDKSFLKNCGIKVIATFTKGTDHIDLKEAAKRKIEIFNSQTGNAVSAAEHTFALILAICKNILLSDEITRKNKFSFYDYKRLELRGKKIGIIGFGNVGSRVGRYAKAFEMDVIANDINPAVIKKHKKFEFKNIDFLLKNADIVTIHIPLNSNNKNFISREKLLLLNDKTIFINTSRGEVIDEGFLIKLLKNRKLYYAGLDVFKNEPEINKVFYKLENVVLTNHIAGKTKDSSKYISNDIFMQVKKHFSL